MIPNSCFHKYAWNNKIHESNSVLICEGAIIFQRSQNLQRIPPRLLKATNFVWLTSDRCGSNLNGFGDLLMLAAIKTMIILKSGTKRLTKRGENQRLSWPWEVAYNVEMVVLRHVSDCLSKEKWPGVRRSCILSTRLTELLFLTRFVSSISKLHFEIWCWKNKSLPYLMCALGA